jgi:hypothetical protein
MLVRSSFVTMARLDCKGHARLLRDRSTISRSLCIEGVSLVNHFRCTFRDALVNMTTDQLIERLRRQLPAAR